MFRKDEGESYNCYVVRILPENEKRCNRSRAIISYFLQKTFKLHKSSQSIKLVESNLPPQIQMKNRPIHENLDTSFVNLSALVKYLRRRQFVGNVRVELSSYEADIVLTAENGLKVREHDQITGRISEGEEALQRLLIRAREPGGIIHVYQTIEETEKPIVEKPTAIIEEKSVVADLPQIEKVAEDAPKSNLKLPKFPFELSNRVDAKAKQPNLSSSEWNMLLDLTSELLRTIDKSLAEANLNFSTAFEKARIEISGDYPFLSPISGVFEYKNGKVSMEEQVSPTLFVASINETLRRILEKLGKNQKFADTHHNTTQKILALIHTHKPLYDKFSITPQLEKIVGA